MTQPAIVTRNLSKSYKLYQRQTGRLAEWLSGGRVCCHRPHWAVRDVNLEVRRGECLGIVGPNGAGKSTLLKMLTGTIQPTTGTYRVEGTVLSLLELGTGFHRELTGRQNVYETSTLLGFPRGYARQRIDDIARFADLGEFFDRPIKIYSSGMMVRLAFSLFMYLEPDVLIVDEALSVGDAAFQRKCFRRMEQMITAQDRAVLIASHDTQSIVKFCTRAMWMDAGAVRLQGNPSEVVEAYLQHTFDRHRVEAPVGPKSEATMARGGGNGADLPTDALLPRSSAGIIYPSAGAQLLGAWLEDRVGKPVKIIPVGHPFAICYAVRFTDPADTPVFGLRVATIRGDVLSAANTRLSGLPTGNYPAGQVEVVRWPLQPGLSPGEYFISCGCVRGDNEESFLFREVDAYRFSIHGVSLSKGLCSLSGRPRLASNDGH